VYIYIVVEYERERERVCDGARVKTANDPSDAVRFATIKNGFAKTTSSFMTVCGVYKSSPSSLQR